jgi:hypothetical protein
VARSPCTARPGRAPGTDTAGTPRASVRQGGERARASARKGGRRPGRAPGRTGNAPAPAPGRAGDAPPDGHGARAEEGVSGTRAHHASCTWSGSARPGVVPRPRPRRHSWRRLPSSSRAVVRSVMPTGVPGRSRPFVAVSCHGSSAVRSGGQGSAGPARGASTGVPARRPRHVRAVRRGTRGGCRGSRRPARRLRVRGSGAWLVEGPRV